MENEKTVIDGAESEVDVKLAELNEMISPYKLAYVDPLRDCVLLDRNARFMTKEQLSRLTENVQHDGFLSQLPFGIRLADGKYKIISGNHRIKAAIKSKLEKVLILYGEESDFDEQRQLAIQLSHNAVNGQDDTVLLRALYADLDDLFLKSYSGINEKELFAYKALDFSSILEKDIELSEIRFMFSEPNKEKVEKLLDTLETKADLDPQSDILVFLSADWFISMMTKVQKKYQIKNRSAALLQMCAIVEKSLTSESVT